MMRVDNRTKLRRTNVFVSILIISQIRIYWYCLYSSIIFSIVL